MRPLPGHALRAEGAPHDSDGRRISWTGTWASVSGEGRALCECGETSPVKPSANQRRLSHKNVHKPNVLESNHNA